MTNIGSPPADLDFGCAQIGISSAPSPASPRDLSKVAAETNPPFHGNEGDHTESDDLVRLLGPEVLAPLVIAKVLEKRKKVEELEKEKARNEADLSAGERWLDKRFPRESWDVRAKAPKTPPAPASSTVDLSSDFAHLPQEPSPAKAPLGAPTTSQANRPCPNGATAAALSSPSSTTEMFPAPSCAPVAPDWLREPMLSPASGSERGSESRRSGAWQQRRIKWAVERLYSDGAPDGINVNFLTKRVAGELESAEAKKAGMSDGGPPSWKSVKRFVNSHRSQPR
jgi:hypothetical protein